MGMVITMSEPTMNLALYGDRSGFLQNYLSNQLQQLGPNLNAFGQRIYDAMQTSYNFVTDQLVRYGLRSELQSSGISAVDNYYEPLLDWQALQNANATMQRWVMANPTVRQLYLDQNIDGYSGEYVDISGSGIADTDYNYRLVMSGVIQDVGDGDEYVIKHYFQDLLPGDRLLDHFEKEVILDSWAASEWLIENCKFDFTCKSETPVEINK